MSAKLLDAEYIDIHEVADLLGKTYEWTRRMVRSGAIKELKIGSRSYFQVEWVEDYLRKNTHTPKARRND